MHLEQGNVDQAERLLRAILSYVESTQAGPGWTLPADMCLWFPSRHGLVPTQLGVAWQAGCRQHERRQRGCRDAVPPGCRHAPPLLAGGAPSPRRTPASVPQGLEHANYATAAENLAGALQRRGAWDEARSLMHKSLETRSTHAGARHPVVAVTLRKLAELELAAAAAEEAAEAAAAAAAARGGSAQGGGGDGGGASAAGGEPRQPAQPGLASRGRQQAVAIAEEALSIAQQAHAEALEWEARRGRPEAGGLLGWLRPKPTLSALRRPQRPDSAALEVAQALRVLARAHAATGAGPAAARDLDQALAVLAEAFPNAGAAAGGGIEQGGDAVQAGSDSSGSSSEGGQGQAAAKEAGSEHGEGEAEARSASSLALALSAKEAARAVRVEKARHELACGLLAELLALAHAAASDSGPDAASVKERWAADGCGTSAQA